MPSPDHMPSSIAEGAKGEEELPTTDNGPFAAYVWKTTADPYVGKITYFRVYSGVLNADSRVWNQTLETEERFGGIAVMRGNEQLPVKVVHAGDIALVPKLGDTSTSLFTGGGFVAARYGFDRRIVRIALFDHTRP